MNVRRLIAGILLASLSSAGLQAQTTPPLQPNPPAEICVNNQCVTSAMTNTSTSTSPSSSTSGSNSSGGRSGSIKWNPGFYGLTSHPMYGPQSSINAWASDISSVNSATNVVGYTLFVTWAALESSTQSNWQFQGCSDPAAQTGCGTTFVIDQILNSFRATGKKVMLAIMPGTWNGSTPPGTSSNNAVPNYILNPATNGNGGCMLYGAPGNSSYSDNGVCGWWQQYNNGGYAANWENANVAGAFDAMIDHLCAVYDQDPVLEGIILDAMDVHYPANASLQHTSYYTAYKGRLTNAKTACPHTNIAVAAAFETDTNTYETAHFAVWAVQNRIAISSSDTGGASLWQPDFSMPLSGSCCWNGSPSGTSGTLAGSWNAWSTGPANPWLIKFASGATVGAQFTYGSTATTFASSISSQSASGTTAAEAPGQLGQGVQVYMGLVPSGDVGFSLPTPSLHSQISSFTLVENGDLCGGVYPENAMGTYTVTASDVVSALNTYYYSSHPSFAIIYSCSGAGGRASLWSGPSGVAATLATSSLTDTGYPPGYP